MRQSNTGSTVVTDFGKNQPYRRVEPSDEEVSAFIEAHPSGASLEEVASVFGWTRTRAGQVLKQALEKALKKAVAKGLTANDFPQTTSMWDRLG